MTRKNKTFAGVLPGSQTDQTAAPVLTTALEYRGFNKGLSQVLHVDYNAVIGELRQALGITSRSGLHAYRYGQVSLRATQAAKVQEVFNSRGITEIWDA